MFRRSVRAFSLLELIPVSIQRGLETRGAEQFCSRLLCYLGQLPPLLVGHHTHDLLERVSHQIIRILDTPGSPQRATIQRGT